MSELAIAPMDDLTDDLRDDALLADGELADREVLSAGEPEADCQSPQVQAFGRVACAGCPFFDGCMRPQAVAARDMVGRQPDAADEDSMSDGIGDMTPETLPLQPKTSYLSELLDERDGVVMAGYEPVQPARADRPSTAPSSEVWWRPEPAVKQAPVQEVDEPQESGDGTVDVSIIEPQPPVTVPDTPVVEIAPAPMMIPDADVVKPMTLESDPAPIATPDIDIHTAMPAPVKEDPAPVTPPEADPLPIIIPETVTAPIPPIQAEPVTPMIVPDASATEAVTQIATRPLDDEKEVTPEEAGDGVCEEVVCDETIKRAGEADAPLIQPVSEVAGASELPIDYCSVVIPEQPRDMAEDMRPLIKSERGDATLPSDYDNAPGDTPLQMSDAPVYDTPPKSAETMFDEAVVSAAPAETLMMPEVAPDIEAAPAPTAPMPGAEPLLLAENEVQLPHMPLIDTPDQAVCEVSVANEEPATDDELLSYPADMAPADHGADPAEREAPNAGYGTSWLAALLGIVAVFTVVQHRRPHAVY